LKQPDPHDHVEVDLGWAAGVTDRGLRHAHNEDDMFLAAPHRGMAIAVVCDGVSSSSNAAAAAAAAVHAAGPQLLEHAGRDARQALVQAAASAQDAVLGVPPLGGGDAPSCTFVGLVLHDGGVTVGWLGDSRAYWLGAGQAVRLTTDHSWAADQVAAGVLTPSQAEAQDAAHGITRWLGTDAPDVLPSIVHFDLPDAGSVVVCSDGLWNYASSAERIGSLLDELPAGATALDRARRLTSFARDSGGHDNITVVVLTATATDEGTS